MTRVLVNGITATAATLQLSARGRWWLDVELDGDHTVSGVVSVAFADLVLSGAVQSGGSFQGRTRLRIVAGRGGWGLELPAVSYSNDLAVKISLVLQDAATACGEILGPLPTGSTGKHFTRIAGPASWVLQQLAPEWRVDLEGVTQLSPWPATTLTSEATRARMDRAAGRVDLAADSIVQLLPGVAVDGMTAVDVEHHYSKGAIRSVLWCDRPAESPRLAAMRKIVMQLLPDYRYSGVYEFRVVSQQGERLNLQPVRSSLGLPSTLRRVRVRPGVPGVRADHRLGSLCLVAFVNRDPSRPVVVGFDDAESPGFVPSRLDLVGERDTAPFVDTAHRVLCVGDIVSIPGPGGGAVGPISVPAATSLSRVRA